jgi:hypothetical protein
MTTAQFAYTHLFRGSTLLLMRQHGLYVSQRNRRGVAWLETEIPYEELLPVELEYHEPAPLRLPPAGTWVAVWIVVQGLSRLLKSEQGLSTELWVACIGFLVGLAGVFLTRRYWGRTVTIVTNRIRITLPNRRGRRDALETFTEALRLRAHAYLRDEYAQVNPLGPIELQLHRLNWLHHLNVLSEQELRTLSTRLTGRLSLEPLNLMGQDLETPYVN